MHRAAAILILISVLAALLGATVAEATVTGSFTGASPTLALSPGGAAFFGPPFTTAPLTTTVSTTLELGVPPVPAPDTPPIPPEVAGRRKVEILLLTDTTGSMGSGGTGALADFQAAIAPGGARIAGVLADIETAAAAAFVPDPIDISWAVAEYKDVVGSNSFVTGYDINTGFGTAAGANAAVAAYVDPLITDGGGLDPEEAQYAAMVDLSTLWDTATGLGGLGGTSIGEAERIVIWTGDGGAHEGGANSIFYPTTFATLTALREQSIAVYAMNIGAPGGAINMPGSLGLPQAATVTEATGGTLVNFSFGQTPASLADAVEDAIIGGSLATPGDGALLEMNNITVRVVEGDLGPWTVAFVERDTLFPVPPLYPFLFDYPTILPPVGENLANPFGFPADWGAESTPYADSWGIAVVAPAIDDTRSVTFELRVDGVLIDTIEVILSTEVPEPSTAMLVLLGALGLLLVTARVRRAAVRNRSAPK